MALHIAFSTHMIAPLAVLLCCRGGAKDVNADERIAIGHDLMAAPVDMTLRAAYPDLYPLHETGEMQRRSVGMHYFC